MIELGVCEGQLEFLSKYYKEEKGIERKLQRFKYPINVQLSTAQEPHRKKLSKYGKELAERIRWIVPRAHTWLEIVHFPSMKVENFIIHGAYCNVLSSEREKKNRTLNKCYYITIQKSLKASPQRLQCFQVSIFQNKAKKYLQKYKNVQHLTKQNLKCIIVVGVGSLGRV